MHSQASTLLHSAVVWHLRTPPNPPAVCSNGALPGRPPAWLFIGNEE